MCTVTVLSVVKLLKSCRAHDLWSSCNCRQCHNACCLYLDVDWHQGRRLGHCGRSDCYVVWEYNIRSRVPVEGKSSVCAIYMKYRTISLIIIIISLGKYYYRYCKHITHARMHARKYARTRRRTHAQNNAHAHPHPPPSLFVVSMRPTMTESRLGAPFSTLARQWPIGDSLKSTTRGRLRIHDSLGFFRV